MSDATQGTAYEAQPHRAAHAALHAVPGSHVVSVAHDHEGVAFWAVRVTRPAPAGRQAVVYLDRDFGVLRIKAGGADRASS